ncbi:MAG: hypothetical protein Phyf2KO_23110 [Phycisphaerales bacterium]
MATDNEIKSKTVTKKELIDRIADETGEKRVTVKKIVQSFLDEVVNDLGEGNRLEFRDFGVFEVRERKARIAQNPKTLERVEVPSKWSVKFKAGRLMRIATEKLGGMTSGATVEAKPVGRNSTVTPNHDGHHAAFAEAKPSVNSRTNVGS